MISDWTIYSVFVPEEGLTCVECFDANDATKDVLTEIESAGYDVESFCQLYNEEGGLWFLRKCWGRWGLTLAQSKIIDEVFGNEFPYEPRISVETDWNEDCYTCESSGEIDLKSLVDTLDVEGLVEYLKFNTINTHKLMEFVREHKAFPCPDCGGVGVTSPHCINCGEVI